MCDDGAVELNGVKVSFMIIADSVYPVRRYILPALEESVAREGKARRSNVKHAPTCHVIERAFGVLKSRWRCLMVGLAQDVDDANNVIVACFLLHYICFDRGDKEEVSMGVAV